MKTGTIVGVTPNSCSVFEIVGPSKTTHLVAAHSPEAAIGVALDRRLVGSASAAHVAELSAPDQALVGLAELNLPGVIARVRTPVPDDAGSFPLRWVLRTDDAVFDPSGRSASSVDQLVELWRCGDRYYRVEPALH